MIFSGSQGWNLNQISIKGGSNVSLSSVVGGSEMGNGGRSYLNRWGETGKSWMWILIETEMLTRYLPWVHFYFHPTVSSHSQWQSLWMLCVFVLISVHDTKLLVFSSYLFFFFLVVRSLEIRYDQCSKMNATTIALLSNISFFLIVAIKPICSHAFFFHNYFVIPFKKYLLNIF